MRPKGGFRRPATTGSHQQAQPPPPDRSIAGGEVAGRQIRPYTARVNLHLDPNRGYVTGSPKTPPGGCGSDSLR